jgi:hypothetical protein
MAVTDGQVQGGATQERSSRIPVRRQERRARLDIMKLASKANVMVGLFIVIGSGAASWGVQVYKAEENAKATGELKIEMKSLTEKLEATNNLDNRVKNTEEDISDIKTQQTKFIDKWEERWPEIIDRFARIETLISQKKQ